ncbi:MAG: YlxR family protein [Fusobacterium sp.]|nr:YlxR family protein [Fusobacterium sp.]
MTERKCVACGEIKDSKDLIKITKQSSTGSVIINHDTKIFGRSAYLCYNISCIETAFKKNKLQKALRTALPEDLKGKIINEF